MFGNTFGWPHLLAILVIVVLLFGATRLPTLARSVGQSMRIFRSEMKQKDEDPDKSAAATAEQTEQGEPGKNELGKK
ncbi:MAG: Sec-independent protein translocase subunit TatA [Microbacteriaceae bacterium]